MNYQATMEFIGRANKFGSILGLDNIRELLNSRESPGPAEDRSYSRN